MTDSDNAADNDFTTLDTVAGASLTVNARILTAEALTITDAASVTINAASTGLTRGSVSTVLDNADTTSAQLLVLLVLILCDWSHHRHDALTNYTVSTSTASGTVTTGAMVDADSLESLTITATAANATVGAIGGTGTAEALSTVTIAATGATADVDDITADTTNSTTDNAMTITLTATTGSTVTTGDINNQFGSITLTASGEGTFNIGGTDGSEMLTFGQASTLT